MYCCVQVRVRHRSERTWTLELLLGEVTCTLCVVCVQYCCVRLLVVSLGLFSKLVDLASQTTALEVFMYRARRAITTPRRCFTADTKFSPPTDEYELDVTGERARKRK